MRTESILVIEDDKNISFMIEAVLEMGGYKSQVCMDGERAYEIIKEQNFSLILLDVMLPGMDGFELMEKIQNLNIPVIFITAKQEVSDKIRGLKLGADDYITKPFDSMELLARIDAVLRRCHKDNQSDILEYGQIEVDILKHEVLQNHEKVLLTPKEYEVLLYFLKNQDVVVRRERLMNDVWGYDFMGETRTIDNHVQNVRKKLGLKGQLVTVHKVGYCLNSMISGKGESM